MKMKMTLVLMSLPATMRTVGWLSHAFLRLMFLGLLSLHQGTTTIFHVLAEAYRVEVDSSASMGPSHCWTPFILTCQLVSMNGTFDASQHNKNFPDKGLTGPSLCRKFTQLHKVKKPTRDPMCPSDVRYAKQIFRSIEQQADASAEIDSTDLGIGREQHNEPNVDDDFIAISGESEDNGGATSAAYDKFSGSKISLTYYGVPSS